MDLDKSFYRECLKLFKNSKEQIHELEIVPLNLKTLAILQRKIRTLSAWTKKNEELKDVLGLINHICEILDLVYAGKIIPDQKVIQSLGHAFSQIEKFISLYEQEEETELKKKIISQFRKSENQLEKLKLRASHNKVKNYFRPQSWTKFFTSYFFFIFILFFSILVYLYAKDISTLITYAPQFLVYTILFCSFMFALQTFIIYKFEHKIRSLKSSQFYLTLGTWSVLTSFCLSFGLDTGLAQTNYFKFLTRYNEGVSAINKNHYMRAIANFNGALSYALSFKQNKLILGRIYHHLGKAHLMQGSYTSADKFLDQGKKYFFNTPNYKAEDMEKIDLLLALAKNKIKLENIESAKKNIEEVSLINNSIKKNHQKKYLSFKIIQEQLQAMIEAKELHFKEAINRLHKTLHLIKDEKTKNFSLLKEEVNCLGAQIQKDYDVYLKNRRSLANENDTNLPFECNPF